MRKEYITKPGFETRYGQFEFLVTPFGLTGAPKCFQTPINYILHLKLDEFVLVYIEYVILFSKNEDENLNHLRKVFDLLKASTFYMKLSKFGFFKK